MNLNSTPSSERLHIGIFGKRNAGKSCVVNALTGQNLAIVSDVKGTTTDPVVKSMELLPLGPVVMTDTPGLDDEGKLGSLRIEKAYQVLDKSNIALLVVDGTVGITREDREILTRIQEKKIPYLVVLNKADLVEPAVREEMTAALADEFVGEDGETPVVWVSAIDNMNINELKERIGSLVPSEDMKGRIVGDLLHPMDYVVLVIPIDKAAPKGRLILPQQQTIRDILEAGAISVVTRNTELSETLDSLGQKPALVITDSQVFEQVAKEVPEDIPLTSFSILFARYKGDLIQEVEGARALDTLEDGDMVLISEGCSHHRQCEDIGTVKIPGWVRKYTGKDLKFAFTSGTEFPKDLSPYRLVIHCGACMLNEKEMQHRLECTKKAGVPTTNYGTAIAYMNGILERSIRMFDL